MSETELAKELQAQGLAEEKASLVGEFAYETMAEFEQTGQLGSLFGMKTFGATDEGVNATINAGAQLVRQGYYLRATEFFVGLLQFEPFHPRVHMWLGLCAHKQRLYANALQFYRQAHGLADQDPLILFYLGEAALLMGEREEGVEALTKATELAKGRKDLFAHNQRGQRLLQVQKMIDEKRAAGAKGG